MKNKTPFPPAPSIVASADGWHWLHTGQPLSGGPFTTQSEARTDFYATQLVSDLTAALAEPDPATPDYITAALAGPRRSSLTDPQFAEMCARIVQEDRQLLEENQRAVARIMKRI